MDKKIILTIIAIILAGGLFWAWQSGVFSSTKPFPIPGGIILFYGEDCPHCKNVEDFIFQNNLKEKVIFKELEVWHNKDNQNILVQVVQKCNIKTNEVGVPFLYDGANCYIGDKDIINFLKNEAGIQ